MSSPSKPVDISSPRRERPPVPAAHTPPNFGTPISASPTPRLLRAQYTGTPPPPNVPLRGVTPTGTRRPSASTANITLPNFDASSSSPRLSLGSFQVPRQTSGTPGNATPGDNPLDDLTDEEKAKVLRRHLVSRAERQNRPELSEQPSGSNAGNISKRSSMSHVHVEREDTEPFPIPYHAPGADVT